MKKLLPIALVATFALAVAAPAAHAEPQHIDAPYVMTWDASGIKGAKYTEIQCYAQTVIASTWRSPSLPLSGSWTYKESGSPGIDPNYVGPVQCYIVAHLKNHKIAYPAPVIWAFEVTP